MDQPCFEALSSSNKTETKNTICRFIKDSEHEEIIREYLFKVNKSLYISTGDFKKVYFDGEELASILNGIANKGIKVVVKCMNPWGHDRIKQDFELVVCSKNHMKLFVFDEKILYIGSANLTNAAIARSDSSRKDCNHEAGILTTDTDLIKQALQHFNHVATKADCKACNKKICKTYRSKLYKSSYKQSN